MSDRTIKRVVFGVFAALMAYILFVPPPALPFKPSNGTYANPCCEPITLADGKLFVGGKFATTYVINIKGNPYMVPDALVEIENGVVVVNRKANPHLIYFVWDGRPETARTAYTSAGVDETTVPTGLELFSDRTGYIFERKGSR